MWISKQVVKQSEKDAIECGKVTMNDNGKIEAVSTGLERSVKVYSPYGYCFCAPKGENLLLTQSGGEQVSFGFETDCTGLETGEIKLCAKSGAYIYLKADGSVEINGKTVSKEGQII